MLKMTDSFWYKSAAREDPAESVFVLVDVLADVDEARSREKEEEEQF